MYSGLPPRERRAVKAALIAGWLAATGAGISATVNPTSTTLTEMGPLAAMIMGLLLSIAAVGALIGVISDRYRFEWVSAWIAAAGFVPYAITIWSLTVTININWLTASFIATVALSFFVSRAFLCAAHAAKLRVVHEASETITSAIEAVQEGTDDGDPIARE